jgi:hypothetical protein
MPVVSVKAKARIRAIFMAITSLQRCLELFGAGDEGTPNRRFQSPKYPMRSAVIVVSSITLPPVWHDAARKSCALCHNRRLAEK